MLRRIIVGLAVLVAAVAVTAAPAPVYRADRTPWLGIAGWDRPHKPSGDCRFRREGGRMTISVPGKGAPAPHLLREVEGDFTVEVRVGGDFEDTDKERRGAGILVTDGTTFIKFGKVAYGHEIAGPQAALEAVTPSITGGVGDGPSFWKPTYLRVERRKGMMRMQYSHDGLRWEPALGPVAIALPKRHKVGVFAESDISGTFEPVFDQFRLTPLN